jgi:hypothetical protein
VKFKELYAQLQSVQNSLVIQNFSFLQVFNTIVVKYSFNFYARELTYGKDVLIFKQYNSIV